MKIQITGDSTINASPDDVWRIIAHQFDQIGVWATAIPKSKAVPVSPTPAGAMVGGRVCSPRGFGDIQETFTYYDEAGRRFGYAAAGLPGFVTHAENNWSVHRLSPTQCQVVIRGDVGLRLLPGVFVAPFFKLYMNHLGQQTLAELKYYVEYGQPHPRKLKAQQREMEQSISPD